MKKHILSTHFSNAFREGFSWLLMAYIAATAVTGLAIPANFLIQILSISAVLTLCSQHAYLQHATKPLEALPILTRLRQLAKVLLITAGSLLGLECISAIALIQAFQHKLFMVDTYPILSVLLEIFQMVFLVALYDVTKNLLYYFLPPLFFIQVMFTSLLFTFILATKISTANLASLWYINPSDSQKLFSYETWVDLTKQFVNQLTSVSPLGLVALCTLCTVVLTFQGLFLPAIIYTSFAFIMAIPMLLVIPPLCEEVIFRAVGIHWLQKEKLLTSNLESPRGFFDILPVSVLNGWLFGLVHFVARQQSTQVLTYLLLTLQGTLWSLLALTMGSIASSYCAHHIWNHLVFTASPVLVFAVDGLAIPLVSITGFCTTGCDIHNCADGMADFDASSSAQERKMHAPIHT